MTEAQKIKKLKGLCITPYCANKSPKGRSCCWGCVRKKYIAGHALEYTFGVWKRNCRRRKKVNTVSFQYFKMLVEKNDYMRKKGTSAKSLQIDREKECGPDCPKEWCWEHGYHENKLQVITLRENRYKYDQSKRDYSAVPF